MSTGIAAQQLQSPVHRLFWRVGGGSEEEISKNKKQITNNIQITSAKSQLNYNAQTHQSKTIYSVKYSADNQWNKTLQIIKSESNPLKFNRRQTRARTFTVRIQTESSGPPSTSRTRQSGKQLDSIVVWEQSIVQTAALFDRTCDACIDNLREKRVTMMQITTDQIRAAGSWC